MADDVTLDPGAGGDTIAADDIGGTKHQRVKVQHGADGSATDVSSASPLPVGDAGGSLTVDDGGTTLSVDDGAGSLTVDGTVAVSGSVAVTDNAGSLTVDNAALSTTGGGVEAAALRVTLANDSTGLVSVDDNGGSLTVDGPLTDVQLRATPVSVEQATSVDVADGGGSLTVDNAALSVTGGGVEANAMRVTVATDSTGVLSVDDNGSTLSVDDGGGNISIDDGGNSITVDGTVTANLAAGTNNIGDVDVLSLPAIPAGTNNIGDVDVLTEPATAADNAVGLPAVVKVAGGWDGTNVQALSTNAAGLLQVGVSGTVAVDPTDETTRELGKVGSYFRTASTDTMTVGSPNTGSHDVNGCSGVGLQFSGTYAAFTFIPQQSTDGGTTWHNSTCSDSQAAVAIEQAGAGLVANSTVLYSMTLVPGATHVRVISFGGGPATGTCNVRITGQSLTRPNAQAVRLDQLLAASSRIRIYDGTDEATVLPVRTQPATTEKGLNVNVLPGRLAIYQAVTAEVAPAISIGVKELLCFFSPAAVAQDVYITEIVISVLVTTASTTAGRTNVEVLKATSVGTGGTNLAAADVGGGLGTSAVITNSAANVMQVKTGGGALGTALIRQGLEHATEPLGDKRYTIFQSSSLEDAIILRGGSADGLNIQVNRVAAHTALVDQWTASIRWIEL